MIQLFESRFSLPKVPMTAMIPFDMKERITEISKELNCSASRVACEAFEAFIAEFERMKKEKEAADAKDKKTTRSR